MYKYLSTYNLYVYNYSENPSIITSEAVLQIYGDSGFMTNINVPTSGTGLYWDLLTIDGTTGILTINNSITRKFICLLFKSKIKLGP